MNFSNKVELLAPAGSQDVLDAAIGEGADAVYAGLKDFNARLRARNFSYKQINALVEKTHLLNKRVYITLNTVFEEWESKKIYNILKFLNIIKPDGIIVQDLGIVNLINRFFPDLKIHASTQMNISSINGVSFLSKYNIKRVILSRELNIEEIKNIRNNTNIELEVFVHGALCVSLSGLCLFSSYLNGKSANRGCCAQPCRRLYIENNNNGYFFSTKDLMLIKYIPELIDIGINSFKIEGRMKSAKYVAAVVRAYREIIDYPSVNKEEAINKSLKALKNDFARDKTTYFFIDKSNLDFISYSQSGSTGLLLGKIIETKIIENNKIGYINSDYELSNNDIIRIYKTNDKKIKPIKVELYNQDNNQYAILIPHEFNAGDIVFLIDKKEIKIKYKHILPKSLNRYKIEPDFSGVIPNINNKIDDKNKQKLLNQGFYVRINNLKDIFTIQTFKPEKVIINLNQENMKFIKNNFKSTYLKNDDVIFYFEPVFFNGFEQSFERDLNYLIENNFKHYIINNIGQLNLLKNKRVNLICGPYLYTFNKYSIDFFKKIGFNYFIPPIENNKENLSNSIENLNRNNWLITVFSNPVLFYINCALNKIYHFDTFMDSLNMNSLNRMLLNNYYKIIISENKTLIIPDKPFSLFDKINELKQKGFNKYIIDFSYLDIKKSYYKKTMNSAFKNDTLQSFTRFNWNSGFHKKTS